MYLVLSKSSQFSVLLWARPTQVDFKRYPAIEDKHFRLMRLKLALIYYSFKKKS